MRIIKRRSPQLNLLLLLCALTFVPQASAQRPDRTQKPETSDDVVRVKTELVQTDVTVIDKRGNVVNGLKPDQFELRVDSRPQPLAFFEEVVAGSPEEEKKTRRHFFDLPRREAVKTGVGSTATAEDELRMTLGALYPRNELPTKVSTSVVTADKGSILNISMQIDGGVLDFGGNRISIVDVLGVALDDRGKFVSFKQRLDIPADAVKTNGRFVSWNQALTLPPGLYQVRVAVRERQNGRTGSAMDWVEVPSTPSWDNR